MDIANLIVIVLKGSILLTEFSLGLRARPNDSLYLVRQPWLLLRSILAMNVIVPLFAVGIAIAFELNPAVKIALVSLALSPIPPLLPKKQLKAGGGQSFIFGLLIFAALLSTVIIPLSLVLLSHVFRLELHIAVAPLAGFVLLFILLPMILGVAVRKLFPAFADKVCDPLSNAAILIILLVSLPIIYVSWPLISSLVGNGTVLAIAVFTLIAMSVGHLLGGPKADNRSVLALASASRHPGIALTIAMANFPEYKKIVIAAVLLYLLVSAVVSLPYLLKRNRQGGGIQATQ